MSSPVALLTLLALGGCGTVRVPASDNTPPTVLMTVLVPNQPNISLDPNSQPVTQNVKDDAIIDLVGTANDDEGVQNTTISGDVELNCVQVGGNLGQLQTRTLLSQNPDLGKKPGDEASTVRMTTLRLSIPDLRKGCNPGFSFVGLDGQFATSGENYHGGKRTTATYKFINP